MWVKALVDHHNDYSLDGSPGVAAGGDRFKKKGQEYTIPEATEAQLLIDAGLVEEVGVKK
jgi:hypothetical protein